MVRSINAKSPPTLGTSAEVVEAEVAGTIRITIRALERQKEPSVTPIFYKLRQNNHLSRHSREFLGIHEQGKERTITVGIGNARP